MKLPVILLLSTAVVLVASDQRTTQQLRTLEALTFSELPLPTSRLSPSEAAALDLLRMRHPNKPGLIQYLERNPRRIQYYLDK